MAKTAARRRRLQEAKEWYPEQGFDENSHVVKAYRKKFRVGRICAMKELCMLGVLSPVKQKQYEDYLKKREERRNARRRQRQEEWPEDQDAYFYYIAGYTSGGAPFGITWEEAKARGLLEEEPEQEKGNSETVR